MRAAVPHQDNPTIQPFMLASQVCNSMYLCVCAAMQSTLRAARTLPACSRVCASAMLALNRNAHSGRVSICLFCL